MKTKDELFKELNFHRQQAEYHYDEIIKIRDEILSKSSPEQREIFEAYYKKISIPMTKH